jgi:hypothetical protein
MHGFGTTAETDVGTVIQATWAMLTTPKPRIGPRSSFGEGQPRIDATHPSQERRPFRCHVRAFAFARPRPFFFEDESCSMQRAADAACRAPLRTGDAPVVCPTQFRQRAVGCLSDDALQRCHVDGRRPSTSLRFGRHRARRALPSDPALQRPPSDPEQRGELVVSTFTGVVRRHRALAECDVVGFSHGDIEVQIRRQLKRLLGLMNESSMDCEIHVSVAILLRRMFIRSFSRALGADYAEICPCNTSSKSYR